MSPSRVHVAVVGAGACGEDVARQAEGVGRAVARAGAVLVCGGLGGVMEAAARGARREGGFTLGLLPGVDKEAANEFIDCAVATGLGHFRNFLIAQTADALVAVAGQYGTLSEVAMALNLGKPVVGLGSWEIEGVLRAGSPEEAVRLAIAAVR
ncbi:MAG: TIGR00725 family protein [Vicinamibacteria bacterium]